MNRRDFLTGTLAAAGWAGSAMKAQAQSTTPGEIVLRYDFNGQAHRWIPALSDYSLATAGMLFQAEIRNFPPEFQTDLKAFYLESVNRSDDAFMYLRRALGSEEGVEPNRLYSISMLIGMLSNAPSGSPPGVGGSPGASVWLKAGISLDEPVTILENRNYVSVHLDKGSQSESGRDVQVVSTIENGRSPDDPWQYVYLERKHDLPYPIKTDDRGVLWAVVGTESGFESLTGIYIWAIWITLRPL